MRWHLAALGLSALLMVAALGMAHAEEASAPAPEIYQVLCLSEFEVIDVRRLEATPEVAGRLVTRRDEKLAAANRLYIPAWHSNLDVQPSNPDYGITPKTYRCSSQARNVELVVLPEPLFGQLSISVTLGVAGRLIVDDLPFDVCRLGGGIERMRFDGRAGSLTFWGAFSRHGEQGKSLANPFDDTRRRFVIEPTGIRTLNQSALGWTVRDRPLVHVDIDYAGSGYDSSHFHQRGPYLGTCRYVGPGMPDSRWRDEDWEFRASGSTLGPALASQSP